jgi:hypothetical protein
MRGVNIQLSKAIRNGTGAALLSFSLITMNSGAIADAQPAEPPGELMGGWLTKDKSKYIEYEFDGRYVYWSEKYKEGGEFKVRGKKIQYSPDVSFKNDEEKSPPEPYVETWNVERPDGGTDELTLKRAGDSLTYMEMDLTQCG